MGSIFIETFGLLAHIAFTCGIIGVLAGMLIVHQERKES